jgi:phosphate/sulfate permease
MAFVFALIPIIVLIAFCSYAAPGTVDEPAITWNLYIAPTMSALTAALILLFIDRRFKNRDRKDEQIARLLTEKDTAKEQAIIEWKTSVSKTLCEIKSDIKILGGALYDKVTWDHCKHEMEKFEARK